MTHLKFDDDPVPAALELILAQLCAAYRRRFHRGYPTEGEEDLRILYRVTEHFTVKRRIEINRLMRHLTLLHHFLIQPCANQPDECSNWPRITLTRHHIA